MKKDRLFYQQLYEKYWLGRMVRTSPGIGAFRRVVKVEMIGPPSFVYGGAVLHFEDGSDSSIHQGESFRPKKSDVEVKPECCHSDKGDPE